MKVTCLMAQTLDGRIGKDSNHFPDWTEKADKKLFVAETKKSGVMIFGRTTFETLPGVLPGRLHVIMSRQAGEWDEKDKNLVYTNKTPQEILEKLATLGFENPIVAGGAVINSLFAKENLIDEIILTISPKIFGSGLGVFRPEVEMDLRLLEVEKLGENSLKTVWKVVK
ncbi:dihydrofolate reductase [bacterium DOLZORAL124_38_8]|nr:MAG: dihydrofolate reductase [bacterium DOLZORAL124_38_8]